MSWLPWRKKKSDHKTVSDLIGDLELKTYADDSLKDRIRMIYLLHLAIEEGNIPIQDNLELDEDEDNLQIIMEIRTLSNSDKYKDKLNAIKLQLSFMDLILRTVAIPWLRAKDERRSAKILFGWEGLFSKSKTVITAVENILSHEDEGLVSKFMNRSELMYNLKVFLTLVPFKYGLLITDISYGYEDVLPSSVAVLAPYVISQGNAPQRKHDNLFGNQDIRRIIQEELDRR